MIFDVCQCIVGGRELFHGEHSKIRFVEIAASIRRSSVKTTSLVRSVVNARVVLRMPYKCLLFENVLITLETDDGIIAKFQTLLGNRLFSELSRYPYYHSSVVNHTSRLYFC